MKILLTSYKFWPDVGGIEVNSQLLANSFSLSGHHVTVVTNTTSPADCSGNSVAFPYHVVRRPSPLALLRLYLWADVVFQNNIELRSLWPILFVRKPLVIAVLTWLRDLKGRVRMIDRFKRWVLRHATRVISISESIRDDSCASSIVIGNPYRSDLFHVYEGHPRATAIAFLGRLVSDKGADLLIDAFSSLLHDPDLIDHLSNHQTALKLTIIGDGPEKANIDAQAHHLGITNSIVFTGLLHGEALVRELNSHHVLAVPSQWPEPFGNVALEGMACGCLVVAADSGGLPDAVGNAGLLYRTGDPTDLASRLREALIMPKASLSLLSQAAAKHLLRHTAATVSQQYLDVLCAAVTK